MLFKVVQVLLNVHKASHAVCVVRFLSLVDRVAWFGSQGTTEQFNQEDQARLLTTKGKKQAEFSRKWFQVGTPAPVTVTAAFFLWIGLPGKGYTAAKLSGIHRG